ncbi:MAG: WecB/TagA/CpsF family glycosyltransferase [Pseudomonadota bacterium]
MSSNIQSMTDTGSFSGQPTGKPAGGAPVRRLLGVDVCVFSGDQAISAVRSALDGTSCAHFAFLNAHGANLACDTPEYRHALSKFTVLSDGIGVDIGSKILFGETFPENLNGTDFIPRLLDSLKEPRYIGLLGARAEIGERACQELATSFPHHNFRFVSDGYFDGGQEQAALDGLAENPVDLLLVALGNPKQELWIARNCRLEHAKVAFGVGALFDFIAGHVPRAPDFLIRMRCEWMYRLWLEPRRMWGRYVVGNPLFLARILRQKLMGGPKLPSDQSADRASGRA